MTNQRRFLMVDDEPEMRMVLTSLLDNVGQCETASSGDEALAAMRRALEENRPYDAVFLDIMMPGMNGHQTAAELRKMEQNHGVPPHKIFKLIMISALEDTKNVCHSFFKEGCADAYVAKPVDHAKLKAELAGLNLLD